MFFAHNALFGARNGVYAVAGAFLRKKGAIVRRRHIFCACCVLTLRRAYGTILIDYKYNAVENVTQDFRARTCTVNAAKPRAQFREIRL